MQIKDNILEYNTYFDNGYDNVFATDKGVFARVDKNHISVLPNDTLGSYFYIRDNGINVTTNNRDKITDCATPFVTNESKVLVAIMNGADKYKLLTNLLSTLAFSHAVSRNVQLVPEIVVQNELSRMGREAVEAALANLSPDTTIISITFEYNLQLDLYNLNCLPNPCSTCG